MADPMLGTTLGKYRIEEKLGQGGMGAVYRGVDTKLDRAVAIKVLPKHLAAEEEFRGRFLREAKKLAQLTHANVVQIYDFGTEGDLTYMAMQCMDGGSLQDLLAEKGRLPPQEAARIVRETARGLARANRAGIIHRDIKPANILLGKDGEVRLGDFGLVKQTGGDDQPLTQTGVVLGTPHYMAPEQCEGLEDIDHRADLYALGLVLYQCLSGVLPAKGTTPLQIIHHRMSQDPEPLKDIAPHVPGPLVIVVEELLIRDRDARLSDAGELAERLDRFVRGPSGAVPQETVQLRPAEASGQAKIPTGKLVRDPEPDEPSGDLIFPKKVKPPSGKLIDHSPDGQGPKKGESKVVYIVLGILAGIMLCFFCVLVAGVLGQK